MFLGLRGFSQNYQCYSEQGMDTLACRLCLPPFSDGIKVPPFRVEPFSKENQKKSESLSSFEKCCKILSSVYIPRNTCISFTLQYSWSKEPDLVGRYLSKKLSYPSVCGQVHSPSLLLAPAEICISSVISRKAISSRWLLFVSVCIRGLDGCTCFQYTELLKYSNSHGVCIHCQIFLGCLLLGHQLSAEFSNCILRTVPGGQKCRTLHYQICVTNSWENPILYTENWVYRGIHCLIYIQFCFKHRLQVPFRTALARHSNEPHSLF